MDITVTISEEGHAILESWLGVGQVQPWVQHALDNKLRRRIDASIEECTDKNPKKLTQEDKLIELSKVTLPTREERDSELKTLKQGGQ